MKPFKRFFFLGQCVPELATFETENYRCLAFFCFVVLIHRSLGLVLFLFCPGLHDHKAGNIMGTAGKFDNLGFITCTTVCF